MNRIFVLLMTICLVGSLAGAQQQPKEVSAATPKLVGPTDISFPAKEDSLLREWDLQMKKLQADYHIDEYHKEAKPIDDAYLEGEKKLHAAYDEGVKKLQAARDDALKPLFVKYKGEQYNGELKPLQERYKSITDYAAIDAGITDEQRGWLKQPNEQGRWVWRKPFDPPKQ